MDYSTFKRINEEDGSVNAGRLAQNLEGSKGKEIYKDCFMLLVEKRKRRSKHIQEGRSFQCECGKSYLSQPALNNHRNTKHRESEQICEKRPRGRPRKYLQYENKPFENDNGRFSQFFEKDSRSNKEGKQYDVNSEIIPVVFEDIYPKYGAKCFICLSDSSDHPLFKRFLNGNPISNEEEKNKKTCDEVFYEYLNHAKISTNKEYFILTMKFVVLMRECLNISRQKEIDSSNGNGSTSWREYTSFVNAETVPEICNEFVTEFLENNDYFGIPTEYERNEIIELIQHFCLWLYQNGYTQSRLSLVS